MILMTVSDNNASDLITISFNVSKIRYNDVDARHISIRECETAVKNEHIISTFKNCHIFSDLVQTSERYDTYRSTLDLSWLSCSCFCSRSSSILRSCFLSS